MKSFCKLLLFFKHTVYYYNVNLLKCIFNLDKCGKSSLPKLTIKESAVPSPIVKKLYHLGISFYLKVIITVVGQQNHRA